jgi:hypothetical protein
MRHFTRKHGIGIQKKGQAHVELPKPIFLLPQDSAFTVQTQHGLKTGTAGDAVAFDPNTGHVNLVSRGDLGHYAPVTVDKHGHVVRDGQATAETQAASDEDPDAEDVAATRDEAQELLADT